MDIDKLLVEAEELINFELNRPENPVNAMVKTTGYSKQFVSFVIGAISLHYNDRKLLEHMVKFVAEEAMQLDPPIDVGVKISAADLSKRIGPICNKLKEDSAFGLDNFGDEFSKQDSPASGMPLLSRLAIIATYCASYNPQTSDQRFFFKGGEIYKRRHKIINSKKLREKCHEIGPRPFDHQRAMFIFLYFCKTYDELFQQYRDADLKIDFTSQIAYLLENGFIKLVSASENLDMPMFISLCNLNYAKHIAQSISSELDLENYLDDFAYQD